MAIPSLEQISQQPGGTLGYIMRNVNALSQDNATSRIKESAAQYAPWTNYANASSKIAYSNMLPYQMQAQVMSNPMIWMALKDNPKALNALMQNLTQSMPTPEQMKGGTNMPPQPGQAGGRGHGLLNNLLGLMGMGGQGQSQPQNPMASMPTQQGTSPQEGQQIGDGGNGYYYDAQGNATPVTSEQAGQQLSGQPKPSPANGAPFNVAPGGMPGVVAKMTKPYTEQPFTPGRTVSTDQGDTSIADAPTVQASQQAIQGIKNLKPILQDISKGAEKWLAPGAKGKVKMGQALGMLKQHFGTLGGIPDAVLESFGIKDSDVSNYAEWETQQQKAVETYMKARSWPQDELAIHKVSKIIEPIAGEGKGYGDRVARELAQLENTVLPNYQQSLSQGFPLQAPAPEHTASVGSISEGEQSPPAQAPINLKPDEWIIYSPQNERIGIATTKQSEALFKDHKGYYRKKT